LDDKGHLILTPELILETWERKLRNKLVKELLVKWKDLLEEDATWENEQNLQPPVLQLLGSTNIRERRTVMFLPKFS